jgi:hypothetical protein
LRRLASAQPRDAGHISIAEKKVHPPNTYMYNLERSSPKLFPPPPQSLGVLRDEFKEKINELEEKSKACVNTIG